MFNFFIKIREYETDFRKVFNPHIQNIKAISGALFTMRIQYEYAQTQCDEGARDGVDIWYMGITRLKALSM